MADDQNQKTSTIDDLVKELSKNNKPDSPLSSNANQPPPNLPGVKVEPKPQPPSPSPMPLKPQVSSGPVSASQQPTTSPTLQSGQAGVGHSTQEYRSSIRTMGEDISSIKSGQKPSGVDVPRRVSPEIPKAVLPGAPKPEMPAPGGPRQVGLGQAEKTGPLPSAPGSKSPVEVDKNRFGLGRTEKTGQLPTAPTPQKFVGPLKSPGIQAPVKVPSEKKSINMTFYLLIAGILVVGAFLYWFLILRTPTPEVVVTPTPTQTAAPTPATKDLSDIFAGTPVNFEVLLSENIGADFKTFINSLALAGGEFLEIDLVQDVEGTLIPLGWLDMFDMALTVYPYGLRDTVVDSATLVFGQSETFNKDGTINFETPNIKKTVFIARVLDATAIGSMMTDWELDLADDLSNYLLVNDTSKEESVNFMDNTYRGVAIRYKNFPYPDMTVDYAIVSLAGQNYLVIAGSREAMFATIDLLLEQ